MRFIQIADAINVLLAAALGCQVALCIFSAAPRIAFLPFVLGLALGFAIADVASGLVHWFCDTYFAPTTRWIGPMFIAPFREHHVEPAALLRHGLLALNGNNCLMASPILVTAGRALGSCQEGLTSDACWSGFLVAFGVTLCVTNQIHAWAHAAAAPALVRGLQRLGVLLAPAHHSAHHRGARHYAVVCGWSNPALNRVLPHVERALAALGAAPTQPGD